MSSVKIQGDPSGTGIFTIKSPNSSTDRELVLPDEAGTVLTSASDIASQATSTVPAFSAYAQNTDQSISNDTWTKVQLPSEDVDSNGTFNTSTYTWTPDVAGWYSVSASLKFLMASYGSSINASIRKNGNYYTNRGLSITANYIQSGTVEIPSFLVHMNGSTDYLEMYTLLAGSGTLLLADDANYWGRTYMTGVLVRAD